MNILKATPILRALLHARIPVFLHGAPGVGKSDLVRSIAPEFGNMIDCRAAQLDAVDLRGLPMIRDGRTAWAIPEFLPCVARDGASGILFLDELSNAPMQVQAALYQLILDRRLGDYELPHGWLIVAAGNRQADRAAAGRMSTALSNRFAHITIEPDAESWCAWAANAGIAPVLIALFRIKADLLHAMPKSADDMAFPTPRAWERVNKILHIAPSIRFGAMSAIIGEAAAIVCEEYIRLWHALPRIADIVANPATARVPDDSSTLYMLAAGLAHSAATVPANFAAILAYSARIPEEFRQMLVSDATLRNKALKETAVYVAYAIAHKVTA